MKKRKTGSRVITILLIVLFLAGLALLGYPFISNQWNQRVMSRAVEAYEDTAQTLSRQDDDRYWKGAEAYNQILNAIGSEKVLLKPEMLVGYEDQLDVSGTGIMGYLTIEKINLQLPIYHGTDASALSAGAGHLQGSSLPVGGENTHSVLSAHRGLPSALLFTRLDELEEGDTFTITVLGRQMTYEVDQITIILPTEFDELAIREGQDLCTLMTCTPYGINTHRLLVRGVRTENAGDPITVRADAVRLDPMVTAVFLGIPLLLFLLIRVLIRTRKRPSGERACKRRKSSMKKRKHLHLTAVLLAALVLLGMGGRTVCAEIMGSVTAALTYADGTGHAADGTVLCYQAAVLTRDENGAEAYTYTSAFEECPVSLEPFDEESSHELAASLAAWIGEQEEITGTACDVDGKGRVAFSDLEEGLYLLMLQEDSTAFYAFDPFLVSIPCEGSYEVDASPKVEVKTLATPPPATSTPAATATPSPAPGERPTVSPKADASDTPKPEKAASTLPQTGQLYWPIPLLAGGGLLFLLIGAFLMRKDKGKKAKDETKKR